MLNFLKNLISKEDKFEKKEEVKIVKPNGKIIRIKAIYSGYVQGVGFRFEAFTIANSLGITGFVKNLQDGDVEIEAQGEESEVKGFLETMKGLKRANVENLTLEDLNIKPYEMTFKIEN